MNKTSIIEAVEECYQRDIVLGTMMREGHKNKNKTVENEKQKEWQRVG